MFTRECSSLSPRRSEKIPLILGDMTNRLLTLINVRKTETEDLAFRSQREAALYHEAT
jgi:hypothetical protein